MSETAKAAVLARANGDFVVQEIATPDVGPREILLRTELAGVCASDAHIAQGHLEGFPYPSILGHEFVGTIARLGSAVTEDMVGQPVRVGDRIIVMPAIACGHCYFCVVEGMPSRCEHIEAYGFYDVEAYPLRGGWSQYVHLANPRTRFVKTTLAPEVAVLLEPFCTPIQGINRIAVRLGDTALVQGSGSVGLLMVVAARAAGAQRIIVVGAPRRRLDVARELGADVTIDLEEIQDSAERVRLVRAETVGHRGVDVAFECAGVPSAITEGLACLRNSGRYCELGHFTDTGDLTLNPHRDMVRSNLTLIGSNGYEASDFVEGLRILERGDYPFERIVSHRLPLNKAGDAVAALTTRGLRLDGVEVCKIALDPWQGAVTAVTHDVV